MRTLNDYFLPAGIISGIHTGNKFTDPVCIPDGGLVAGVLINTSVAATTITHTFNIFKNGADTGVVVTMNGVVPANTGLLLLPDSNLYVDVADSIFVKSNDETVNAVNATVGWIIRR
jgi:hypothetical protein